MSWKAIGLGIGRHCGSFSSRPWLRWSAIFVLSLVSSCRTRAPSASATDKPRGEQELDIMESVFRYLFEHNRSVLTERHQVEYFFLRVDKLNPPPELLSRFAGHVPPVEKASASESDIRYGVRDIKTHGRGIILDIRSVRWIDDDTVDVEGGYVEASLSASGDTYRVERRQGKWVVVNDTLHWVS
jgi:hypothetical protein